MGKRRKQIPRVLSILALLKPILAVLADIFKIAREILLFFKS